MSHTCITETLSTEDGRVAQGKRKGPGFGGACTQAPRPSPTVRSCVRRDAKYVSTAAALSGAASAMVSLRACTGTQDACEHGPAMDVLRSVSIAGAGV